MTLRLVVELEEKLHKIKEGHDASGKKSCRHCILRYKKSTKIVNFFIGDLTKVTERDDTIAHTTFADLYNSEENKDVTEENMGLSFKIINTIRKKKYSGQSRNPVGYVMSDNQLVTDTLSLRMPFLSITHDVGLFKDNLMVHMADKKPLTIAELPIRPVQSIPRRQTQWNRPNVSDPPEEPETQLQIHPDIEIENTFIEHLDDRFWRYFRDSEKSYMGSPFDTKNPKTPQSKPSTFKTYVILMSKKLPLRQLLPSFEVNPQTGYDMDKLLFKISRINMTFENEDRFTSVINVTTIRFIVLTIVFLKGL